MNYLPAGLGVDITPDNAKPHQPRKTRSCEEFNRQISAPSNVVCRWRSLQPAKLLTGSCVTSGLVSFVGRDSPCKSKLSRWDNSLPNTKESVPTPMPRISRRISKQKSRWESIPCSDKCNCTSHSRWESLPKITEESTPLVKCTDATLKKKENTTGAPCCPRRHRSAESMEKERTNVSRRRRRHSENENLSILEKIVLSCDNSHDDAPSCPRRLLPEESLKRFESSSDKGPPKLKHRSSSNIHDSNDDDKSVDAAQIEPTDKTLPSETLEGSINLDLDRISSPFDDYFQCPYISEVSFDLMSQDMSALSLFVD